MAAENVPPLLLYEPLLLSQAVIGEAFARDRRCCRALKVDCLSDLPFFNKDKENVSCINGRITVFIIRQVLNFFSSPELFLIISLAARCLIFQDHFISPVTRQGCLLCKRSTAKSSRRAPPSRETLDASPGSTFAVAPRGTSRAAKTTRDFSL